MDIVEIITSRAKGLGEKVFCIPNIPKDKLKGAIEGITECAETSETVIAVLDTTLFGGCDNGVVFSNKAMYFKSLMSERQVISYDDIAFAEAKGVVLKELVITWRHGDQKTKYEATDYNGKAAAAILNAIVSAREDETRRAAAKDVAMQTTEDPVKGKAEFEAARQRIRNNGLILVVLGVVLCFSSLWWGVAAIVIGIELLKQYDNDAKLYDLGMPVSVYEADVKELIGQAWIGAVIIIGVFGVPVQAKKSHNRMRAISEVLKFLKAASEEGVITRFLQSYGEEDEQTRRFVIGYLDFAESKGEIIRMHLGSITMVFEPKCLESALEKLDNAAKSETRVAREILLKSVQEDTGMSDDIAENFINLPECGLETYTFADGTYYVHGINNDRVCVCASCGIAEIVNDESAEGEFFCSDYCRETEEVCKKVIERLRKEKFEKAGVDGAAFGGGLASIIDSLRDNRRGVAKRLRPVVDSETGAETYVQTGHGVAAEKANDRIDKLLGRSATTVGDDNAAGGPDRIVDGKLIQSKYCASASKSVDAGFGKDGNYRYYDGNGQPMQLEVPRDQYEKAVSVMREKIRNGKVPGVTDPADAEKLVRKGHLTLKQAQNLCKFGTIESLAYDAYTGAIVGATVGGISFVLTAALTYYNTKDIKLSVRAAIGAGLETGGKAFAVYVLSAQVQRTAFVKAFIHESAIDVNWGAHGKFVERMGNGLSKMSGAKSGTFTKNANVAVKGAVITAAATFAVTSAWEVGKMCCGRMSGMQCLKNIAVSGGGITAGTAGALFLGAIMAPIPGGVFLGSLLGGAIGGMIGSGMAKAGMDKLIEDDAVMVMAIVSDEFKIIAASFCLNSEEIKEATAELDKLANTKGFVEDVYSRDAFRRQYVARLLKPIFIRICMARPLLFDKDVSEKAIEVSVQVA